MDFFIIIIKSILITHTHLNVKAHVLVSLMMCGVQLWDELTPLHTRVLSQCTRQCLESFSKLFNGILLQTRTGLQRGDKQGVTLLQFISQWCSKDRKEKTKSRSICLNLVHFSHSQICIPLRMKWSVSPTQSHWLLLQLPVVCPTDSEWQKLAIVQVKQ